MLSSSIENNLSNPPLPPFSKGGNLFSPFEKGGLRGIILVHHCEPPTHDGSFENRAAFSCLLVSILLLIAHGFPLIACFMLYISLSNLPVYDLSTLASSSGMPYATTSPPPSPPSGPRSM